MQTRWKRDQLSIIDQWRSSHKSKFHPENKSRDLVQLKNELLELMEKQEKTRNQKQKERIARLHYNLRASLEQELKNYNGPYYVEANGITKQISGCTDLDLFGNADGQKTVSLHKVDDNGKQVGIIEHLIGVELLYEGHRCFS